MAELGVGVDDGIAQRFDHLGFDVVRQVATGLGCGHATPAVDDLFLFGLRVMHTGKGADIGLKHIRQFARRRFA